jgi:hypothetical protein
MTETIALFGATGGTGKYLLPAALEAGYKVQALVRTPSKVETKHENLTLIEGDFSNDAAITETVKGAHYVISCAGGPLGKPKDYPEGMMLNFITLLWPKLEAESQLKVFLYQSGAFVPKPDGSNPFMMKLMRATMGRMVGITPNVDENEKVGKFMDSNPTKSFSVIVTRPGMINDKEGGQKLVASDSPPMGSITFKDLAFFTLEAIKDESLAGKYPFVVVAKK